MPSAPTLHNSQAEHKRPGVPRSAFASPEAAKKHPASPWTAHLRSLIGQRVTVATFGPASLLEYSGKLVAIAFDHMNCAIEMDSGVVMTFKNVHHISSGGPA